MASPKVNAASKELATYQIATALLCSLSTVVVLLRLLSRKVSDARLWWDGIFIITALIFAWAIAGTLFRSVSEGIKNSDQALKFEAERTLGRTSLLLQDMYYCCISFIKFSILFFYLRIFPVNKWITALLVSVLLCLLVQKGGHCFGNPGLFTIGVSVPIIVTDALILLLPLPVVWKLQLHPKEKVALCEIFSLGIFATSASCIRLRSLTQVHLYFLRNNIEPDLAIICACLPTMMPLVRLVRGSLASGITRLRTRPRTITRFSMQWPRASSPKGILNTDGDGFEHLADSVELSTATSQARKGLLLDDKAPRLGEEGLLPGRVYIRNDVDVSHNQIEYLNLS